MSRMFMGLDPLLETRDCQTGERHPTRDEPGFAAAEMLYIDPATCTGCGLCVEECPVRAIFDEQDVPAEWQHFIEKNAAHYRRE